MESKANASSKIGADDVRGIAPCEKVQTSMIATTTNYAKSSERHFAARPLSGENSLTERQSAFRSFLLATPRRRRAASVHKSYSDDSAYQEIGARLAISR